ncbi:hypothetical protein C0995_003482, partial [Termitomyces sp. Mi166
MSEVKLCALKDYLDDMLGKGFIRPSASSTSMPVLFAKKKDVDHLRSTKIYTKIDLWSEYNN